MRKILMFAFGLASLVVMTGAASADYIVVKHDELKASCAKAGGTFEEREKGYSCDSKSGGTTIHITCTNNGNCIVYDNSVYDPNKRTHANPSGNPVYTLGSAGATPGNSKVSTSGKTPGANNTFAVGGLSTTRPASAKTAPGNSTGNPGTTVGGGGSLFSHDRPNFRPQ